MNVQELIDSLERMEPDAEVRLAFQPDYPLQYRIDDVVEDLGHEHQPVGLPADERGPETWYCDSDGECEAEWDHEPRGTELQPNGDGSGIVYIGEGGQVYDTPYLPGSARDALGWSR